MRKDKSFYGKTNWAGALLAGALFISTGGIFFPLHAADTGDNLSVDQIQQQSEITVTGQVLDETGMGIPGANVSVKENHIPKENFAPKVNKNDNNSSNEIDDFW